MADTTEYTLLELTLDQQRLHTFIDIFFQYGAFADQKTVAFSIFEIDGERIIALLTKSGRGKHAEVRMITVAKKALEYKNIQGKHLTMIIMLSKSPCFNCREELEVFLEKMKNKGAFVTVILRIANLYYGDGGGEKQIIDQLAGWRNYLINERIIHLFILEPISVTRELTWYSKEDVKPSDWEKVVDS